jgi:hypothetical protein
VVLRGGCSERCAGGVVDVQDFELIVGETIEDAEGVADQRDGADAGAVGDGLCGLWPGGDAGQGGAEAAFQRGLGGGMVGGGVGEKVIEVAEGGFGEDAPHAGRWRAKVAAS